MTSSKINQKNYNTWSSSYDDYPNPTVAIDEIHFPKFYKTWSKNKVLEIGCGTGRHTQRLVEQGNFVIGLDISEGMLSRAQEKLPNVKFIHDDFMQHKFSANSFEKILMSLVLEHISNLDSFFKKVSFILEKNGEILISEIHPKRGEQGSLAHFKTDDGNEIHLSSKSHCEDEILRSAAKSGLKLNLKKDILANAELTTIKEKWHKYQDRPMIQIWSFFK